MTTSSQFGTTSQLVAGTLQLTLPTKCRWWYVQNQSTQPLTVSFISGDWGFMSSIILAPAAFDGAPGGYLDSLGVPYFAPEGVLLSSADPIGAFGSGASPYAPPTAFIEAATGPGSFT